MKLLVDVGNTAIKFASLENQELSFLGRFYLSDLSTKSMNKVLEKHIKFDEIIISSVVPNKNKFLTKYFLKKYNLSPRFVKVGDYKDLKINIDNPNELGIDLYCDLVGALTFFENKPTIIVDLGTASKLLVLDNKVFSSCVIVPGIEMSKKMLTKDAALIPEIASKSVKKISESHNTVDVINSSVYYGHIEMINGLINRIEKETNKKYQVIVTGGNANQVIHDLNPSYQYNELLAFIGMKEIINRG